MAVSFSKTNEIWLIQISDMIFYLYVYDCLLSYGHNGPRPKAEGHYGCPKVKQPITYLLIGS